MPDGTTVATYPHIRFTFCRRHGQWLGKLQRPAVLDADLWKAEQALRCMVRSGHVTRELYEGTWDAVRDHAYMIGENAQPEGLRRALEIASRGVVDFGSRVVHALRSTSHLER